MEPDFKTGIPQKNLVITFAESLPHETSVHLESIVKKYDDSWIKSRLSTISQRISTLDKKLNAFFIRSETIQRLYNERRALYAEEAQLKTDLSFLMSVYNDYKTFLSNQKKSNYKVVTPLFFNYILTEHFGMESLYFNMPPLPPALANSSKPVTVRDLARYLNDNDNDNDDDDLSESKTRWGGRRKSTRHRKKQHRAKTMKKNKKRKSA